MPFLWRSKSSSGSGSGSGTGTGTETQHAETAKANATDAKALEQIKSLNGHPGHLTAAESKALERFRTLVTDANLYTPASGSTRASHSDATLCRFLRARRFDPDKALKQFSDCEAWRKQNNVDELYRTFPVEEMELAKKYYPTWTGRRDKRGLPVYVYRLSSLDSKVQKELNAVPVERRYQRIVALYEYMFHGIFNLCAALAPSSESPSTSPSAASSSQSQLRTREQLCTGSTIIDLSGVSLTQMWGVRGHLQQSSTLGTANYPETLDSIFVVNSPSFFPTVWGWIQGWFDANTRNKIKILSNPLKDPNTLAVLTSFIAPENLPRAYGGELEWSAGEPPNLDGEAREWLREYMGLEGEVPIRGPIFVDPYAADAKARVGGGGAQPMETSSSSKTVSEVDSGVGLEDTLMKDAELKLASKIPLPPTPAPASTATLVAA